MLTPAVVRLVARGKARSVPVRRWLEGLAFALVVVTVTQIVFTVPPPVAPATAHQAGTLPPAAPYTAPPPRTPEAARREASGFGLPSAPAEPAQPAATLPPAPPVPSGSSYSSFSSSLLPSASATAADPDDDVDIPSFMKR